MSELKENNLFKDFKLTTLSLKNRNTIGLLTLVLILFGIMAYRSLPKELFPEINTPYILVQTTYPGNSPVDIENLVTNPIEKELESITGIKNMNSVSAQDASMVFIEFNFDVDIETALQDVRDAVSKAKPELPNDMPSDPYIADIDFSEFPFININLSGDYSVNELKRFAEMLEDEIESIPEVSKVQVQGLSEREVSIRVDQAKLEANEMTFNDIENAISYENMNISGGEILVDGTRRSLRTEGEFKSVDEMMNTIVKQEDQHVVYLKDVATVINGYADPSSIARLNGQPVVSLQVIKKGGENLLRATDKIHMILDRVRDNNELPKDLSITITNDQSEMIKKQLTDLENNMLQSILLVVVVLFFFLGTRNALLVGIAIPMSMFLSFLVLQLIGFKINMIVLFSLILALGMLVDNGIVVVENIYRYVSSGRFSNFESAKRATGEVAIPIITSTLTTLAAFFPLAFWDSMVGEFMKYLPITLIVVLTSSLFVALIIIPVAANIIVKKDAHLEKPNRRKSHIIAIILAALGGLSLLAGINWLGTLLMISAIVTLFNLYIFNAIGSWFQVTFLSRLENFYARILRYSITGKRPYLFFGGTILLMFITLGWYFGSNPKVLFFPNNNPSYINILVELPIGTDILATDEFMKLMEADVNELLGDNRAIVKSVLTNIGAGAVGENETGSLGGKPSRGLITITFLDYEERKGANTSAIMQEVAETFKSKYPGVTVSLEKNSMGPPSGKPVNIEVTGADYDRIIALTDTLTGVIESAGIQGIEKLQIDLNLGKPEMIVHIDRERARRYGLSTAQIASTIRTALFGKEISDFKQGDEEYPIQLRLQDQDRYDAAALMNLRIQFRDNRGNLSKVPISAVADFTYSSTYSSVKHNDAKRVVTLWSNVIEGYNATEVNNQIKSVLQGFEMPNGYSYAFTGEQEDQAESMSFLLRALFLAVALILIILVTQFNSLLRPLIILSSVLFSTIGVFGGLATFKMEFVVVMTGIGIVSLAGVAVNNAIVLIDFIEQLKKRKRAELGYEEDSFLPLKYATECIIEAGRTRLRPVLLTAITTILGLIPMAIGMNIDFEGFLNHMRPNIYIGGDQVSFWGPISWTVIFGLTFTTFLTLVMVPVMYRITTRIQIFFRRLRGIPTPRD
jgi:multidrug efflux pump